MNADPDGDGNLNWEEYAFGLDPRVPDERVFHGEVVGEEGNRFLAATARRRKDCSDLKWELESSDQLPGDPAVEAI